MKCIATVKLPQKIKFYARTLFLIKSSILLFSYFGIFCKSNTSVYHTKVKYIETVLNHTVVGCVKGPIKRKALKYSLVKLSQARKRYNYKEVVGKLIQILNDFFVSVLQNLNRIEMEGCAIYKLFNAVSRFKAKVDNAPVEPSLFALRYLEVFVPRSRTRQAKVFGAILRTEVERDRRNRQKRKESKRLEHKAGDIKVQSLF